MIQTRLFQYNNINFESLDELKKKLKNARDFKKNI